MYFKVKYHLYILEIKTSVRSKTSISKCWSGMLYLFSTVLLEHYNLKTVFQDYMTPQNIRACNFSIDNDKLGKSFVPITWLEIDLNHHYVTK